MTDRKGDAADAARGLTDALDRMSSRLGDVKQASEERDEELARYGRRNRRLILWTIMSVVLDIALSFAIAVLAIQAHNASTAARDASASNLALCQAGNAARRQQVELWDFLLNITRPPATVQQKHVVAEFRAHLAVIFAPRNCAALGQKHKPD